MTPYTCIIIDDEHHAIGLLSARLKMLYNNIEVTGTYTTWTDGLEAVRRNIADIVFLDISIDGKNGLDILRLVPTLESEVIFVTAYTEYALDAFRLAASGYIVKPIGDIELNAAVNKTIERVKNKRLARMHNTAAHTHLKIGIPSGKGINYYNINDIIYFEAVNNYTRLVMQEGELISSYNIGKIQTILEGMPFYQIHRSYIVNINYVVRYEGAGIVIMSNKKEIPVSRNSKEGFLKLFNSLNAGE